MELDGGRSSELDVDGLLAIDCANHATFSTTEASLPATMQDSDVCYGMLDDIAITVLLYAVIFAKTEDVSMMGIPIPAAVPEGETQDVPFLR